MAKNKINDLRDHLFETLERLKDDEDPMDLDRARAIADVSRVIVDSAKVEVAFMRETGSLNSTGFLPSGEDEDENGVTTLSRPARRKELA
jgi:hypothetical protein